MRQGVHLHWIVRKPRGRHGLVCRAAHFEPSELEREGDNLPGGFWQAWHVRVASYPFTASWTQKFLSLLKPNVLGKEGWGWLIAWTMLFVFAFGQIPPPRGVQSSLACQHVIVTTRWEAQQSLATYSWVINWAKTPGPSANLTWRSHQCGDIDVQNRTAHRIILRVNTVCQKAF